MFKINQNYIKMKAHWYLLKAKNHSLKARFNKEWIKLQLSTNNLSFKRLNKYRKLVKNKYLPPQNSWN